MSLKTYLVQFHKEVLLNQDDRTKFNTDLTNPIVVQGNVDSAGDLWLTSDAADEVGVTYSETTTTETLFYGDEFTVIMEK